MSNETKWTPGPWHVHTHIERHGPDESFYWAISEEPDEDQPCQYISTCDGPVEMDIDGAMANAHLIAAAPCLYGALEALLEKCHAEPHGEHERHVAITALAKARGES